MSGRYPSTHGVNRNLRSFNIDPKHCLLSDVFRAENYTTMMLGKWHLNQDQTRTIRTSPVPPASSAPPIKPPFPLPPAPSTWPSTPPYPLPPTHPPANSRAHRQRVQL